MAINILTDDIINQIAAGEVIENPSAVIKELIENSIDANSTQIDIEVKHAGIKNITIKDNGCGISKDDLKRAPLRHATSKIKDFNDLYSITTMGFRGEALASIFSISKAKIVSREKNCHKSFEISSYDMEVKESACENGTTIIINDIFFNTPARKKYLRSENLELKSILEVINRYSIAYPEIKFTLKHNGKIMINKPIFNNLKDNLYYILGKDLKGNLLEINEQAKGLKLTGVIAKPSNITYPFRKNQFLFANKRYIKSKLLKDAIYEGFGTNLMEARHPVFILFIEIDPEVIDVNIHPTKIEIKFENELEVYEFVRNAIKTAFENNETFKPFEPEKIKEKEIELHKKFENIIPNIKEKTQSEKTYFTKDYQKAFEHQDQFISDVRLIEEKEIITNNLNELEIDSNTTQENENNNSQTQKEYGPLYEILKEYRIVGQINKTFIILETKIAMIVVDQHVAEEKFYFETFKEQIENKQVKTQNLLKPHIISLSKEEKLLFDENKSLLEKLGFQAEEFGAEEIIVRKVPLGIQNQTLDPKLIKDIIHETTIDKRFKMLEEEKIEKLASMSCKRSIKAGHEMTTPEIHTMIENLKKLKEPFNCPHGRPILLKWDFTELEKKFKRIV